MAFDLRDLDQGANPEGAAFFLSQTYFTQLVESFDIHQALRAPDPSFHLAQEIGSSGQQLVPRLPQKSNGRSQVGSGNILEVLHRSPPTKGKFQIPNTDNEIYFV
jgi:hypothetical protein